MGLLEGGKFGVPCPSVGNCSTRLVGGRGVWDILTSDSNSLAEDCFCRLVYMTAMVLTHLQVVLVQQACVLCISLEHCLSSFGGDKLHTFHKSVFNTIMEENNSTHLRSAARVSLDTFYRPGT